MLRRITSLIVAVALLVTSLVIVTPMSAQAALSGSRIVPTISRPLIDATKMPDPFIPDDNNVIGYNPIEYNPLFEALEQKQFHGRDLMARFEKTYHYTDVVAAYDHFVNSVYHYETTISFKDYDVNLYTIKMMYHVFTLDNPKAFWFTDVKLYQGYTYEYEYEDGWWVAVPVPYYYIQYTLPATKDEIKELNYQVFSRSSDILFELMWDTSITSEAERARAVFDKLISLNEYDPTKVTPHNNDMLGALLYGSSNPQSVCRAYQYLMQQCGIQCVALSYHMTDDCFTDYWTCGIYVDGEWGVVDPDREVRSGAVGTYFNFMPSQLLDYGYLCGTNDPVGYSPYYP